MRLIRGNSWTNSGAKALVFLFFQACLVPSGAMADVPFPSCTSVGCADPTDYGAYLHNDPANVLSPATPADSIPNDFQLGASDAWKYMPGTGLNIVNAWGLSTGRPDVVIAVLDSGIFWGPNDATANAALGLKAALNTDELPVPTGCPAPVSPHQHSHDCNGDGVVNVLDFAGQSCPAGIVSDVNGNGNGSLDAQDLILLCSDGTDGWAGDPSSAANGYVDDISGWDFFQDDNDPFDDVRYGHGTGEAGDSTAEANDGGAFPGVAPSAMFLPLRVGDSFVVVGTDFAQAVVYATDWGVSVIQEALGGIGVSPFGQAAVDYAYDHGVPMIASAADEEARHHNFPAGYAHTIWVNSVRGGDSTFSIVSGPENYDVLNGCTNYGGQAWVTISSTACSSEATGRASGLAALLVSHGKNLVDAGVLAPWDAARGVPFSAQEVRQIFRASAEDIDRSADLSLGMTSLLQGFLSGPTPETFFGATRFPTQSGWDQYTGYGRPDALRMLEIASGPIPPEADLTGGPLWFDVIDPAATPLVPVLGSAAAERADGWVDYSLQVGCGVQPQIFEEIGAGTSMVRLDQANLASWNPAATAVLCGFDPASASEIEADVDAHAVTLRLVVLDRFGRRGEDRRTVAIHSDPTLRFAPRVLGASGEASPALVDLNRDGVLDIVYGTADGAVHALWGDSGVDLPGFPVYTDLLPVVERSPVSPAYSSAAVPLPHETILAAVAADDLDGDGRIEIVIASTEGKLYVFDDHGRRRAGFPVTSDPALSQASNRNNFNDADPGFMAAPTLANLDLPGVDPNLEIIVSSTDGHVYAWRADGSLLTGFPVRIADRAMVSVDPATGVATPLPGVDAKDRLTKLVGSPAVGDLDGDGRPEIVVTSNEEYGGSPGFGTDSFLMQLLLAGAFDLGDFQADVGGRVYALHANGNAHVDALGDPAPFVAGWPALVPMFASQLLPNIGTGIPGSPALADLNPADADPSLAVAIFGTIGPPMLFRPDGQPFYGADLLGRPVSLALDFPSGGFFSGVPATVGSADGPFMGGLGSGAFGDLNGDGSPEYVAPTAGIRKLIDVAAPANQQFGDHQMTAWNPQTGELFGLAPGEPEFPVVMDDMQFLSSPSVGDVDGDGLADIVNASGTYLVRAYRGDGSQPAGWPKFTHGWGIASPTLGDVDGDGLIEVVMLTREGRLFVWDTPAPATAAGQQWQGFGRDRRNSGNLESGVPLVAAALGFRESLLWDLESASLELAALSDSLSLSAARTLIARFVLQLALPAVESGSLDFGAALLPWVEFGLSQVAGDGSFPQLVQLHEDFVDAVGRAAARAVDELQCGAGDWSCRRSARRAERFIASGVRVAAQGRTRLAVLYWSRAIRMTLGGR